jgi:sensor domain CHASE-containing protein
MKKLIIIGVGVAIAIVVSVLSWQHFRVPSDVEIRQKVIGGWAASVV